MTNLMYTPEIETANTLCNKYYHDMYLNWYEAKEAAIHSTDVFIEYLNDNNTDKSKDSDIIYWKTVSEIIKTNSI